MMQCLYIKTWHLDNFLEGTIEIENVDIHFDLTPKGPRDFFKETLSKTIVLGYVIQKWKLKPFFETPTIQNWSKVFN